MTKVTKKRLAKSSAFGIIAQIWRILSRIVLTPLILSKIGLSGYGIWVIIFSITGQLNIIDTGFGVAYAKLTAEYDSRRDYRTLTTMLSSGIVLILGFATFALPIIWLIRIPLLNFLNVPADSLLEASQTLLIVTSVILIRFSFGSVYRVIEGLQRLYIVFSLKILKSFIDFCITIILLINGWGLTGLAIGFASGELITIAIARYLCHKIEPRIGITPFRSTRIGVLRILQLGSKFQLLSIMATLFNTGIKILASIFFGVETAGLYELARKLLSLGGAIGSSILGPLLSAFSNLHTQISAAGKISKLYFLSSRILSAVNILCFSFLFLFANETVFLWTGQNFPLTVWTIQIMAFNRFLGTLTGVGTASLRARENIRLEFSTALISAVIGFGFAWPMSQLYGYKGFLLAFFLGGFIAPIRFFIKYNQFEGYPVVAYFKSVIIRPLFAIIPTILIYLVATGYITIPAIVSEPRLQTLITLTLWGCIFLVSTATSYWFLVLSSEERTGLSDKISHWLQK